MPALLVEGDLYQVEIHGYHVGQDVNTILHYLCEDAEVTATTTVILQALSAAFVAGPLNQMANNYLPTEIILKHILGLTSTDPETVALNFSDESVRGFASGTTGGVVESSLPSYVSATVRKLGAGSISTEYLPVAGPDPAVEAERVFRGRIASPAVPEPQTLSPQSNWLVEAYRAALTAAWETMINLETPAGADHAIFQMVTLSLIAGGEVRTNAGLPVIAFQRVLSMPVNYYVGSQLSRKDLGPA